MAGGSSKSFAVAKSVAPKSIEDESIKAVGDETRRRMAVAGANSRQGANKYWTAMSTGNPTQVKKQTLG